MVPSIRNFDNQEKIPKKPVTNSSIELRICLKTAIVVFLKTMNLIKKQVYFTIAEKSFILSFNSNRK